MQTYSFCICVFGCARTFFFLLRLKTWHCWLLGFLFVAIHSHGSWNIPARMEGTCSILWNFKNVISGMPMSCGSSVCINGLRIRRYTEDALRTMEPMEQMHTFALHFNPRPAGSPWQRKLTFCFTSKDTVLWSTFYFSQITFSRGGNGRAPSTRGKENQRKPESPNVSLLCTFYWVLKRAGERCETASIGSAFLTLDWSIFSSIGLLMTFRACHLFLLAWGGRGSDVLSLMQYWSSPVRAPHTSNLLFWQVGSHRSHWSRRNGSGGPVNIPAPCRH